MKLDATLLQERFKTFSKAFQFAIDNTGLNHSEIYSKIGMDKSHWSKIYNGEIDLPQRSTRNKLFNVVGVVIKKDNDGWFLANKNQNICTELGLPNLVEERTADYKSQDIESILSRKKEKIKEILTIARELEKNSSITLGDKTTTTNQKNHELTLILKILVKRFDKIINDLKF